MELGLDPTALKDAEWAQRFNEWAYAQGAKGKLIENALLRAAAKIFEAQKR